MQVADLLIWVRGGWLPPLLNVFILLLGLFLILLVLIQRGKGGGLAGAFGGSGGSSAFGTRAGDQFTRITLTVAAIWVLLIMLMVKMVQPNVRHRHRQRPSSRNKAATRLSSGIPRPIPTESNGSRRKRA